MGLREWWNSLKQQPQVRVEVSVGVDLQQEDPKITRARRAATAHAQAGDYAAAVSDLERVRDLESADDSEPDCVSEIRRAKYLQKAGRGSEASEIFHRLLKKHRKDAWLTIDLLNAMRLHLQREGRAGDAIHYGLAFRLARIKLYRDWRAEAQTAIANPVESYGMKDLEKLIRENQQREGRAGDAIHYGLAFRLARIKLYRDWRAEAQTAIANPVESYGMKDLEKLIRENQQRDVELCDKWLGELLDSTDIQRVVATLCTRSGVPEQAESLVERLNRGIEQQIGPFDYLQAEGVE